MTSLFISYSRRDIESARRLTDAFKGQKFDYWIDWEGIPPTVDWWQEIENGIEEADVFLFLISPHSARSKICKQEIEHAVSNGKRLIPLLVSDCSPEDAPSEIRHLNWIFFRESDDFETSFGKLITAIDTDYEWVQSHRQLQVKALEWERNNQEKSFLLQGTELQNAEFQLTRNSSKEPHPTDLQYRYIFNSRESTDRQRRVTTGISIALIIALAALTVFGFVQAGLARTAQATAESNLLISQTAQADAVNKQALADSNAATAVANEQEAKRQTQIALARQLAAQAKSILETDSFKQSTAILLGVQSMKLFASVDADQVLQSNTFADPIIRMDGDGPISSVAFSPNGKYVVSGSWDGTSRIWDAFTGEELARVTQDGWVSLVAFSPDGQNVLSVGCEGVETFQCSTGKATVLVWDAASGKGMARMIHKAGISSAIFSSDGKYVASGGCDERTARGCIDPTVIVWEALTGKEIARMKHNNWVSSMAFSPDDDYLLTGSWDGTARVWVSATGKEIARMYRGDFNTQVLCVDFSPDGKYVVVGSLDLVATVWEVSTGKEIARMEHNSHVNSVAFSPDGKYVVSSGGEDRTARVWEALTGKEIARMTYNGRAASVAFSPDGNFVLSVGCIGSNDYTCSGGEGTVLVGEALTGKEITRWTDGDGISSAVFSPDGKYVVSGSSDGSAQVWAVSRGKEIAYFQPDLNSISISALAFSVDGNYVISASEETMYIWEIATREELVRMTHDDPVNSVSFSPDGRYVVSGSSDGTARVWEVSTGREIARMRHAEGVSSVAFSPDGNYVVSGSQDGAIRLWQAVTGKEIASLTHGDYVQFVVFSRDGKYLLSESCDLYRADECTDSTLVVLDILSGKEKARIHYSGNLSTSAFSSDGIYMAAEDRAGSVQVWQTSTGKEVVRMMSGGDAYSIAFSPDGQYVMVGVCDKRASNDCIEGTAHVWEIITGKETVSIVLDDFGGEIALRFSPDGKFLVSSIGNMIHTWESATGKEVARMTHNYGVTSTAFSPDGKYLVTGACEKIQIGGSCLQAAVHVWEISTGKEISRMFHDDSVNSLAFSPDGTKIVSAGWSAIRVWIFQPEDLITEACVRLPRNLTHDEWNQYIGSALPYEATCSNLPIEAEPTLIP